MSTHPHFHPGDPVLVSSPGAAVFTRKQGVVTSEEFEKVASAYFRPTCVEVKVAGLRDVQVVPVSWLSLVGEP